MATKLEKVTQAFENLTLEDQIAAHKANAETLKAAIDEHRAELSNKINELDEVKDALKS